MAGVCPLPCRDVRLVLSEAKEPGEGENMQEVAQKLTRFIPQNVRLDIFVSLWEEYRDEGELAREIGMGNVVWGKGVYGVFRGDIVEKTLSGK